MHQGYHAGGLRAAREVVTPHIPELAPQLGTDKRIILEALQDAYAQEDHDPASVSWVHWNKAERSTIASFCINTQIDHLVVGEGRKAQFRTFYPSRSKSNSPWDAYRKGLRTTQIEGARYTMDTYANGHDEAHTWWSKAARRYRTLGRDALQYRNFHPPGPSKDAVTYEGKYLARALRSKAYVALAHVPIELTYALPGPKERTSAAHDLSYIITSLGGRHAKELLEQKIIVGEYEITRNALGRYILTYDDPEDSKRVLPRMHSLPSVTMKCPAHTPHRREFNETPDDSDTKVTSLQLFTHAAINQANRYGLFDNRFYAAEGFYT